MNQQQKQMKFINKCIIKYGNEYDYSNVFYTDAHTKVAIICKEHGEFLQRPNDHLTGNGCPGCAKQQRKNTMIERYGVEHSQQSPSVREKSKQTMLERYGVEFPQQSRQIAETRRKNNLRKYGDHPSRLESVKAKAKTTNQLRHGVEYSQQSPIVREKSKQTMLKRYGVEHALQNTQIYEKFCNTMLKRYGVDHPSQCETLIKKRATTILDRYGVKHPNQQHLAETLPILVDREWLYQQYIIAGKTAQQISKELCVSDSTIKSYLTQHEINIKYSVGFSYKCVSWLECIMQTENIYIQHALNGGEFRIPGTKYRVDGFCEDTNTVYEFHGTVYHGDPQVFEPTERCHPWSTLCASELHANTVERENTIKSKGYNLVVMWERNWDNIQSKRTVKDNKNAFN